MIEMNIMVFFFKTGLVCSVYVIWTQIFSGIVYTKYPDLTNITHGLDMIPIYLDNEYDPENDMKTVQPLINHEKNLFIQIRIQHIFIQLTFITVNRIFYLCIDVCYYLVRKQLVIIFHCGTVIVKNRPGYFWLLLHLYMYMCHSP